MDDDDGEREKEEKGEEKAKSVKADDKLGFIKRMAHATSHQMNKWLLQPIFFSGNQKWLGRTTLQEKLDLPFLRAQAFLSSQFSPVRGRHGLGVFELWLGLRVKVWCHGSHRSFSLSWFGLCQLSPREKTSHHGKWHSITSPSTELSPWKHIHKRDRLRSRVMTFCLLYPSRSGQ